VPNSTLPSTPTHFLSPLATQPPPPRKGTFATNKGQPPRFLSFGNGGGGYVVVVATTIALRCSPPNVVGKKKQ